MQVLKILAKSKAIPLVFLLNYFKEVAFQLKFYYFVGLKKFQLEVEEEDDFLLFGLVSDFKPSKISHFLGKISLPFERIQDLLLPDFNPKAEISFSRFACLDEENHLDFSLLTNREFGYWLFKELKQFNYLLIVRGGLEFFDSDNFIQQCRNLKGVQFIAPIENEKLKQKLSGIV
jgi:hypothetical protein